MRGSAPRQPGPVNWARVGTITKQKSKCLLIHASICRVFTSDSILPIDPLETSVGSSDENALALIVLCLRDVCASYTRFTPPALSSNGAFHVPSPRGLANVLATSVMLRRVSPSKEPFKVECNVNGGWINIENRATVSRGVQNEMSFLTLPGAEMCRLRFKYQREGMVWRLLRTIVPRGAPYHQFPNRFSQWVWLQNPIGPKLLTLMRRDHFRRPPHWTQVTAIELNMGGRFLRPENGFKK